MRSQLEKPYSGINLIYHCLSLLAWAHKLTTMNFLGRIARNYLLENQDNLPYALCNIRNSGRFVFVTRGYHVLSFHPFMKRVHIDEFPAAYGFELSESKIQRINKVISKHNNNWYLYLDHSNPFTHLPPERNIMLDDYLKKLEVIENIILE
jgi:hypothetical protein